MKRLASQIVLSCCMVGALFASDNPTAFPTRQKIEQLLRSDTAPTKKRMALQLYLKTITKANEKISAEDAAFLKRILLTPAISSDAGVFQEAKSFLFAHRLLKTDFELKIKTAIEKNINASDYIVNALDLTRDLILLESETTESSAQTRKIREEKYKEYACATIRKNYDIFASAIDRKSATLTSITEPSLLANDAPRIAEAIIDRLQRSPSFGLIQYLRTPYIWPPALPVSLQNDKGISTLAKLADSDSAPPKIRQSARALLAETFFTVPQPKNWRRWCSSNISSSFDRKEAAEQALKTENAPGNIQMKAMLYLFNTAKSKKIPPPLLSFIKRNVPQTHSIEVAAAAESVLRTYLEKTPGDKEAKSLHSTVLNNTCKRLYKNYVPKPDDTMTYAFFFPQEETKCDSDDFFKNSTIEAMPQDGAGSDR